MAFLDWLKSSAYVMVMAMVPVVEVKGAIPIGVALGMPLWEAFTLAVICGFFPTPIIMLFFKPVAGFLRKHIGFMKRFLDWLEKRADSKGEIVRKYSMIGLFILVAVPLPGTGVWTGSLVASVLGLRLRHALPIIFLGNIISALLILAVSSFAFT